jgi:hypothetical protein
MSTDILNWLIGDFGRVEYNGRQTKDGNMIYEIMRLGKLYKIEVSDSTTIDDIRIQFKKRDLEDTLYELSQLPWTKKRLEENAERLRREIDELTAARDGSKK